MDTIRNLIILDNFAQSLDNIFSLVANVMRRMALRGRRVPLMIIFYRFFPNGIKCWIENNEMNFIFFYWTKVLKSLQRIRRIVIQAVFAKIIKPFNIIIRGDLITRIENVFDPREIGMKEGTIFIILMTIDIFSVITCFCDRSY